VRKGNNVSLFDTQSDIIEYLGGELDATADYFDKDTAVAMKYLAEHFTRLAPLFEAICKYSMDESDGNGNIVYLYRHLIAEDRKVRASDE
jgi:hypothetical protein